MKNARKDLGIVAMIAGSGAVGVLATLLVAVAARGPAAAPQQIDARQQAVRERVEAQRVTVEGTTSTEKESVSIMIRGSASYGQRNPPIIYVDGVRVDGDRGEALRLLNPDQIDGIEVLKGDAAKELYGNEARHGVIQIVTKSKEGS